MMDLFTHGQKLQMFVLRSDSLNRLSTTETKVLSLQSGVLAIVSTVSHENLVSSEGPFFSDFLSRFVGCIYSSKQDESTVQINEYSLMQ